TAARAARRGPAARACFRDHQGLSRSACGRRLRALVRSKPEEAEALLGRPPPHPLAEPESAACGNARRSVQGQARRARQAYRGREFYHPVAARRGETCERTA